MNILPTPSQDGAITAGVASVIQEQVPLGVHTWFGTGGLARWYSGPKTTEQFQEAVRWAQRQGVSVVLIGEGANVLVSDAGCEQLVIRPRIDTFSVAEHDAHAAHVTAGAGASFAELISFCLDNQLLGLEEFSGIPGTVGGSVFINIHYFNFLLSDFLVRATVIQQETGELLQVDRAWFQFGYNQSTLQTQSYFLVDATFAVRRATAVETAYARGRSVEIVRHRRQRYPNGRTCGSFFRNFHADEVTIVSNGKKMIYIAYYLDKLGIKGQLRVGGAHVSYQHANMIVTDDTASSADVIQLARTMQQLVYDAFGIVPEAECQLLGFAEYPLLRRSDLAS